MARRRFRHSQRFDTQADRSHEEYLLNQPAQLTTRTELLRLIRGGEDTYLELKVRLSNSERITQGIVALANTNGGTIVFGVNDQLRIEGVANPEWVQEELTRICREEIVPPIIPLIDTIAFDSGKRVVVLFQKFTKMLCFSFTFLFNSKWLSTGTSVNVKISAPSKAKPKV